MENFHQLNYFRFVAQTENISEAARKLHISQPSLSQSVKRLEEEIGHTLFERIGRHIVLNDNGRILLDAVERMDRIYQGALREITEKSEHAQKEVSVYIGCASLHLPQLLEYLKRKTPDIKYHIFQWRENGMEENDIGVVALEGRAEEHFDAGNPVFGGLRYEVLFEEEIVLALPLHHPLAGKESLTPADLQGENLICLNESWELGKSIQKIIAGLKEKPEVSVWVDNPNLMRELLGKGLGMAFVPSISWKGFAEDAVVTKKVSGLDVRRTVCVCYGEEKYITTAERECINGIREYFFLI